MIARKRLRSAVETVREVRVDVCFDRRREVAEFYVQTLGLRPWPSDRQLPGGFGLGDPQRGVMLQFRHDPAIDHLRRRTTISVDCLDALASRLHELAWPFRRQRSLCGSGDAIEVADPLGHRLTIRAQRAL